MIRIIRYHGCDPALGTAPNIKIKPPVFASPTDAWNHFVRHPDEFLPVDDEDGVSLDAQMYQDEDIFDSIDRLYRSKGVDSSTPHLSELDGNDETSEEQAETEPAEEQASDE